MPAVPGSESGRVKRLYEFVCSACARELELRVPLAARDRQRCPTCRAPLVRVPHFRTVGFRIPGYMKASYDEQDVLPDDPEEREQFHRDAAESRVYSSKLGVPSGMVRK